MSTGEPSLPNKQYKNTNQNADDTHGNCSNSAKNAEIDQMGIQPRSQRSRDSSQRGCASFTPATQQDKRPKRNSANISYAESTSSESEASDFSLKTENQDASGKPEVYHSSQADSPGIHGEKAPSAGASLQDHSSSAESSKATRTCYKPSNSGSAHAKSKNKRRNRSQGIANHGVKRIHHQEIVVVETDGKIPQWSALPFEILVLIMAFASGSPYDEDFRPNDSVTWLLSAARTCKAFTEPAITILYRDPPLWTLERPHALLEILKKPKDDKLFDYSVKVKRLQFDVIRSLAYTSPGRGLFEIGSLVPYIPQVEEINIFDSMQKTLTRRLGRSFRWTYSQKFLLALEENHVQLKVWQWDAKLCSWLTGRSKVDWIAELHSKRAFRTLRKLVLVNFNLEDLGSKEHHKLELGDFGVCERFSHLPKLQQLVCDSSDLVDESFLKYAPSTLTHITLSNCTFLLAESLQLFLECHGSQLLEIHLMHNQSLNLSFLPCLSKSCPALQVLKMNMNYYKAIRSLQDSEPIYDELIGIDEIPTWPSSLRTLEMIHLRNWSIESATMLFTSLVDAASTLPDLRRLVLKAILSIGWRERVHFREEWIGKIEKVFKRVCLDPDPDPYLMTMRMFRHWKANQVAEMNLVSRGINDNKSETGQACETPATERRNLRKRGDSSTQEDSSTLTNGRKLIEDSETMFIQGMCDTVDVRIDNLRPAESQFTEGDFLDSDGNDEDDGEWNGEDLYSD